MGAISSHSLTIDIVSDVVCPWCIIGYKQLQLALQRMPDVFDVKLCWHPFELNPQMPETGQPLREHLRQKYGQDAERGNALRGQLQSLGESLGFAFNHTADTRMVNTFRAHQMLHWSALHNKQTELKLSLFEAFFTHNLDVNAPEVLIERCAMVGLDALEADQVLQDGRYAAPVREQEAIWREREVYAVPTFVFQNQYVVPGAQEADAFVRVLGRIRERELATASNE